MVYKLQHVCGLNIALSGGCVYDISNNIINILCIQIIYVVIIFCHYSFLTKQSERRKYNMFNDQNK